MGTLNTMAGRKMQSLEATITRADGTVEHLGTIAYWHRNPLRLWAWRLGQLLKRI